MAEVVLSAADLGDPPVTWVAEAKGGGWEPLWHVDSERLEKANGSEDGDVYVYGRRYAVNMKTRMLRPLYWRESPSERRVMRGTWFWKHHKSGRWYPYDEEDAERIEAVHQTAPVLLRSREETELPLVDGLHKVILRRRPAPAATTRAATAAAAAASTTLTATSQADPSSSSSELLPPLVPPPLEWTVRQRVASGGLLKDMNWRAVRRGYGEYSYPEETEMEELPVDHLFLVVHGIGEALWSRETVRTLSIREHTAAMRSMSMSARSEFAAGLGRGDETPTADASGGSGGGSADANGEGGSSGGDTDEKGKEGRFEFLPVEWHESVHSSESDLTKRLMAATLPTVPVIREVANSVVLDVMIFMTGSLQAEILREVGGRMNAIYTAFLKANPGFATSKNCRVSIIGHSLGSIIAFDILQGQDTGDIALRPGEAGSGGSGNATGRQADSGGSSASNGETSANEERSSSLQGQSGATSSSTTMDVAPANKGKACNSCGASTKVPVPKLDFEPAAFFACGSPIGCFLALRSDAKGSDYRLPTVPRFFNIFHPHDPVAYRIEPLLSPGAGSLMPAMVPHKGGLRLHMKLRSTQRQLVQSVGNTITAWTDGVRAIGTLQWPSRSRLSITSGAANASPALLEEDAAPKEAGNAAAAAAAAATGGIADSSSGGGGSSASGGGSINVPGMAASCSSGGGKAAQDAAAALVKELAINGGDRVDYCLQETNFTAANPYLGAITSHTSYLSDEDFVWFVMRVAALAPGEPLPKELTQVLPGFA